MFCRFQEFRQALLPKILSKLLGEISYNISRENFTLLKEPYRTVWSESSKIQTLMAKMS